MTPAENEYLQLWFTIMLRLYGMVALSAILYGMYLLLTAAAVCVLWRRSNKYSLALYVLLFLTFAITTIAFALELAYFNNLIDKTFVHYTNTVEYIQYRIRDAYEDLRGPNSALSWLTNPNGTQLLFGDAIIVWRAWVAWRGQRSVVIPAILLLVYSFLLSNAGGVLNTLEIVLEDLDDETYYRIDKNMNNVFDAGFALSIACNLYASALILYKASKFMSTAGSAVTQQFSKMALFAESGVVYLFFQIVFCGMYVGIVSKKTPVSGSTISALNIWTDFARYISAMYPSVLILILSYKRSMVDPDDIAQTTKRVGEVTTTDYSGKFYQPSTGYNSNVTGMPSMGYAQANPQNPSSYPYPQPSGYPSPMNTTPHPAEVRPDSAVWSADNLDKNTPGGQDYGYTPPVVLNGPAYHNSS